MRAIMMTKGLIALVDDKDYERASEHRWYGSRHGKVWYAFACSGGRRFGMHRFILGEIAKGSHVDHRNGNGLDNRRANLRLCTPSQNQANQHARRGASRFKGVSWDRKRKRWKARIRVSQKLRALGWFKTEEAAALAYDQAAIAAWGEFACVNFPEPSPE